MIFRNREISIIEKSTLFNTLVVTVGFIILSAVSSYSETGTGRDNNGSRVLTLQACIARALELNLSLTQSLIKIDNRDQEIKEVKATAYPQLELSANYTRLGNLTKIDFGEGQKISFVPEDNYLFELTLNQLLYSGGQVQAALRLAKTAKDTVYFEKLLTEENIIMLVTMYFNQTLLSDELVAVAKETVDTVAAHLANVKVMKEQGLVSEFDLLRAEVELANVKPLLIQANNRQRLAYARLSDVIQWDDDKLVIEGEFDKEPLSIPEEDLMTQAYENRWELKIVKTAIAMTNETVAIARGDYKPTLVFFGNYDWANDEIDLTTGDGEWNYGWALGLQANWKLFDGFATNARVVRAKGELKLAELEKEKLLDSIKLEVTEALNNYHESMELIESQEKNVEQARRSLEIAEVRYNQGVSSQLEVMDSRTALTQAQSQYALAAHNFSLAKLLLMKSLGLIRSEWIQKSTRSPEVD